MGCGQSNNLDDQKGLNGSNDAKKESNKAEDKLTSEKNNTENNLKQDNNYKVNEKIDNGVDVNKNGTKEMNNNPNNEEDDADMNFCAEDEKNQDLINDDEDSVQDQDSDAPIPLIVFGIFPPKVNKFEVLQAPLSVRDFHPISTKSIIKAELEKGGENAPLIKEHWDNHKNIPGELVTNLLLEYIENTQKEKGCNRFFISGFPRCEDNSKTWKSLCGDKAKVISVIYLSYTRREYHKELDIEASKLGTSFDYLTMNERYNYFLLNTRYVFDDFGKKRVIKLSASLPDSTITNKVMKSGLFKKLGE